MEGLATRTPAGRVEFGEIPITLLARELERRAQQVPLAALTAG
jgi:hypothetical protein